MKIIRGEQHFGFLHIYLLIRKCAEIMEGLNHGSIVELVSSSKKSQVINKEEVAYRWPPVVDLDEVTL